MPPVPSTDDLLKKVEELDTRLRALEAAPQQPNRTQRGGSFRLIPQDGNPPSLFTFGGYPHPETGVDEFGVTAYDSKGDIVLATGENDEGLVFPHLYGHWHNAAGSTALNANGGYKSVTSGTFDDLYEHYFEIPLHNSFYTLVPVGVDVGTTGEIRIVAIGGAPNTDTLTLPSGTSGTVRCNWLHGFAIGWGDSDPDATAIVVVQARRTAGAGNVHVYQPKLACWRNSRFANGTATSGGLALV